jgi:hypothetical protein
VAAVIYEITATVAPERVAEYETFMREHHIPALLATGRFRSADLARAAPGRYRIRYEAADQAELERYVASDAGGLRAEFTARFPSGIELSREVWTVIETWSGTGVDAIASPDASDGGAA